MIKHIDTIDATIYDNILVACGCIQFDSRITFGGFFFKFFGRIVRKIPYLC